MSFLEQRLILAFSACKLCYNIEGVSAILQDFVIPLKKSNSISSSMCSKDRKIVIGPKKAKPFKVNGLIFMNFIEYEKFRSTLGVEEKKKFLSRQNLSPKLKNNLNLNDWSSDTRYLTNTEIQQISGIYTGGIAAAVAEQGNTQSKTTKGKKVYHSSSLRYKGLLSLKSDLLRGSFYFVLSRKKMLYFDKIAKKAFQEIFTYGLLTPVNIDQLLKTIHLLTDRGEFKTIDPAFT